MATAVLTNVPTEITKCESITGWSGDTFILDSGVFVQGSNSVSCALTTNGNNSIEYATSNAPGGEFDATNIHIRFWWYLEFIGNIDTIANDGIEVIITSDSGVARYTISGRDVYDGGWVQAVIDTSKTPTTGSVPTTNCSAVGLDVNTVSKPRNVPSNTYIDAMYFGDGYTVTGGTSGDEIDWSHIAALDLIERYGIVTNLDDIYFLGGEVTICNSATTTWFKSGQKVQFRDSGGIKNYSATLFGVIWAGSGLRADITGGAWGAAGTQDYLFDASDAAIVAFDMTGVQFAKANSVLFESVADVQNCVFDACGQVVSDGCTFKFNSFVNSVDTGGAFLWPADDTNVSDLNFAICDRDVEYDASSDATPNFLNIVHDDNAGDFDVNNSSGAIVTIPLSGTSNGNSYTGAFAVTFQASVTLTFTVTAKASGLAVQFARINIINASTKAELYQIETNASGIATQAHTYAGDLAIEGWIREFNLAGDDYIPGEFAGTIKSTGFDNNTVLIKY